MEGDGSNSGVAMDSANPLLRAVFLRRLRLTRLLLEGGAYVNESDGQGQTPLMVACRTQHTDAQSASRVKLVQFLLEKGADPNIQDKEGHSALMHACQEQAGPEVVSLLLASGADISLEDQSGTSALVYAVMAGDWTVLKLLLDTCKAKGKEVIIIATDKFPQGKLEAQRYLSIPPAFGPLEQTSAAPASPSEIQLITSPQCTSSSSSSLSSSCPPKPIFSFKEVKTCGVSSHPCSPSRLRGLSQEAANRLQQPLLRLNSEPWLKIPTSQLCQQQQQQQPQAASPSKNDSYHPEEFSVSVPILEGDNSVHSNSCRWYEGRLARENGVEGQDRKHCTKHAGRQKISLPSLLSPHSVSHPNLHSVNLGADSPASGAKLHSTSLHSMASSSLHSIIQRRKLGADIYNSDPQLTGDIPSPPTDGKRPASLHRSSTLCSRESSLALGPSSRVLSRYERRGSGAFLLDHSSTQAKPRSLPPLTINSTTNTPNLHVYNFGPGAAAGFSEDSKFLPSAPPGHPTELSRKMLLRRHSMQTEQFKATV